MKVVDDVRRTSGRTLRWRASYESGFETICNCNNGYLMCGGWWRSLMFATDSRNLGLAFIPVNIQHRLAILRLFTSQSTHVHKSFPRRPIGCVLPFLHTFVPTRVLLFFWILSIFSVFLHATDILSLLFISFEHMTIQRNRIVSFRNFYSVQKFRWCVMIWIKPLYLNSQLPTCLPLTHNTHETYSFYTWTISCA